MVLLEGRRVDVVPFGVVEGRVALGAGRGMVVRLKLVAAGWL